jgi:soluble lytic murein transglycosylase-like protein
MIARRKLGALAAALALAPAASPESPQEAARKAMEASVARQAAAVAAMRLAVAKQRAALSTVLPEARAKSIEAAVGAPFFMLSWPALGAACDPMPEEELAPLIQQAARQEGLEESLLRAVAEQESGLRACAVSPRGAMGLMQLMPATAQELGVQDPFDPRENLLSGARFLKQLLTRFGGDAALALGAYNSGPGRVAESGGVPAIPETVRYVREILSRLPPP